MSRQGVSSADIIKRMQESRAVYRLSGSKLAELHDQGVPDQVLDYLYQSEIDRERREAVNGFYDAYPYSYYGRDWFFGPRRLWPNPYRW